MPSPTIAFSLITCADIKAAAFSAATISRAALRSRIVFCKTSSGNFAKMQVQAGDDLHISELTVYNPAGCIIKTATNLTIQSSFSFNIDTATQTSTNADCWWHGISAGNHQLEVKNGATFALFTDFESISFATISGAPYSNNKVVREWMKRQVFYCKTSQGRFAKLRVEWGTDLIIRRLVVYNANGTQHLDKSNIIVPQTWTLDADTGNVGAAGYDLWWQAANATTHYLVPTNGAKISFESYYQFEKYLPLLKNSGIRNALVISGSTNRGYDNWTEAEKLQLREFLYLLETNQSLPLTAPPVLTADKYLNSCDAIRIYMAHCAQSLWIDANNKVGWHITGSGVTYLEHLFDMRKLYDFNAANGHSFSFYVMGAVTHWHPGNTYQYLKDNNLIKATRWDTIKAVADWVRANLIHITWFGDNSNGGPFATQEDQYEYLYGYRGLPLVDKMLTPLPGKKRITHGCWGTDGFLAAVLRTVNVPVRHGRSNFSGFSHSRAEFFTEGKNLAHGDDPYNGWVRLGINNVPVHRIFYSDAEISTLIDAPAALPGKTVPETASFYHSKHSVDLAVEFKTNYLLRYRCQDKASGISTGAGSKVWDNLHEYFTDAQIATIVADCDTAINAIAGGCATIASA